MSTALVSHDLLPKIGLRGFNDLSLEPAADQISQWQRNREDQILALWHGEENDARLLTWLRQNDRRFALVIASGPSGVRSVQPEFGDRVRGLPWGLSNQPTGWSAHAFWKQQRLRKFVEATRAAGAGPPPWHLLEAPRAPEHVLACYLCVVGGLGVREMPDVWESGFKEEVDYWEREGTGKVAAVAWERDRADASALHGFLVATEALVHQPESEAASGPR